MVPQAGCPAVAMCVANKARQMPHWLRDNGRPASPPSPEASWPTSCTKVPAGPFDLLGNPYPATGTIELLRYTPKKFLQAATEAGLNNEQASVGIGAAEAAP